VEEGEEVHEEEEVILVELPLFSEESENPNEDLANLPKENRHHDTEDDNK
jgi:hypothetical protein